MVEVFDLLGGSLLIGGVPERLANRCVKRLGHGVIVGAGSEEPLIIALRLLSQGRIVALEAPQQLVGHLLLTSRLGSAVFYRGLATVDLSLSVIVLGFQLLGPLFGNRLALLQAFLKELTFIPFAFLLGKLVIEMVAHFFSVGSAQSLGIVAKAFGEKNRSIIFGTVGRPSAVQLFLACKAHILGKGKLSVSGGLHQLLTPFRGGLGKRLPENRFQLLGIFPGQGLHAPGQILTKLFSRALIRLLSFRGLAALPGLLTLLSITGLT